jgi:Ni/Fe-hydrogenase subunit HybB-like protein
VSSHDLVHAPVGGKLMTRSYRWLLALTALGAAVLVWRLLGGLGAVANLNNGYPWGLWVSFDIVVGTALGCGGYAVAILVYILNRGHYHPLVRPAVLTSLLGYGLAGLAVCIDLGRWWEIWKVPVFFWRWTHSPQLEVAICVMSYVGVLMVELSPALFEKWRDSPNSRLRNVATGALKLLDKSLIWLLALGLLLPTMHQSSLGTMMLLPGPRLHPLWFTPWLPFLFLVSALVMGYGVVACESTFAARAFGRPFESEMLAKLGKVAAGVALFWLVFRIGEVAVAGELSQITGWRGLVFLVELALHAAPVVILASAARRLQPRWQARAGLLLVLAGTLFRIDTYLIAFQPGSHWSYFPALPELILTLGIVAGEIALYIWAVRRLPILTAGTPAHTSAG